MRVYVEIQEEKCYEDFFSKYIDENNKLKQMYYGAQFIFRVKSNDTEIDEHILFDFYLIANKYQEQAEFSVEVYLHEDNKDEIYGLSRYSVFQEVKNRRGSIICNNRKSQFLTKGLKGIKRLIPVLNIDKDSLQFLRTDINCDIWEKIVNGEKENVENLPNAIYRLCWRLLLGKVGTGNSVLSKIRKEMFLSSEFYELIDGIPVISLLVFAMLDHAFREDAVEHYKDIIKEKTKVNSLKLGEEDFLYEQQEYQNKIYYEVNKFLSNENYDNKTLWLSRQQKILHPFVVKEMYEAITISEGIIQLMENIVYHAGDLEDNGKGLLGIYIRNFEKDKNVFQRKYPEYMEFCGKQKIKSKYYLEMMVADLSGTNIAQKFMDNNHEFIQLHYDVIIEKLKELGIAKPDIEGIRLESFFNPTKEESLFWNVFFSFPDKAVNHYGLQIFDSIIGTKNGLFEVISGTQSYCNRKSTTTISKYNGSKYKIICPFSGYSSLDTNIYDSMFGYDYNSKVEDGRRIQGDEFGTPCTIEEKKIYINSIVNTMKEKEGHLFCFDVNSFSSIECMVKALVLYIFQVKQISLEVSLNFALLNCKTYQIINIVRILALFYDKQGMNIKMKNVQIYIRGEKVGEEILFAGEKLEEVKNNIAKCSCIRGIMFDNLQAVNKVLERKGGKE